MFVVQKNKSTVNINYSVTKNTPVVLAQINDLNWLQLPFEFNLIQGQQGNTDLGRASPTCVMWKGVKQTVKMINTVQSRWTAFLLLFLRRQINPSVFPCE